MDLYVRPVWHMTGSGSPVSNTGIFYGKVLFLMRKLGDGGRGEVSAINSLKPASRSVYSAMVEWGSIVRIRLRRLRLVFFYFCIHKLWQVADPGEWGKCVPHQHTAYLPVKIPPSLGNQSGATTANQVCFWKYCIAIMFGKLLQREAVFHWNCSDPQLSLIHIWRCRRSTLCRSRWSPYH